MARGQLHTRAQCHTSASSSPYKLSKFSLCLSPDSRWMTDAADLQWTLIYWPASDCEIHIGLDLLLITDLGQVCLSLSVDYIRNK